MTRERVLVAVPLLMIASGVLTIHGQVPAAPPERVSFEAASIKPNDGSSPGQAVRLQPGGRLNVVNMPIRALITFAYQLQDSQLIGGPSWLERDRFDIVAKLDGDVTLTEPGKPDRAMLAMRTLLEERFKLAIHPETREMDIFALMMVKPGQPGPELKPAAQDCSPEALAERRKAPPDPSKQFFCGLRVTGPGKISMSGMPISFYVRNLSVQAGRIVVDRTGLEGRWDFTLTYLQPPPPGQVAPAAPPASELDAPDLFTALRQQLGLKLEPTRGPVDVMVIEGVEKPVND